MIFTAMQRDDPDMMYTPVMVDGKYVLVGVNAQELFRSAVGEEEWNSRCRAAYEKEYGTVPAIDSYKPKPIQPPPILSFRRFFNLKGEQ